jgi:hypothetical protein
MNAPDAGADVRCATDSGAGDDVQPRLLRLADELAALRRVDTLVAGAVDPIGMFSPMPGR